MSQTDPEITDTNLFTEKTDAWVFADQLNADLEDALSFDKIAAVRGIGLSPESYTAGDTHDFSIKPIPESVLSQLPSRITRRYSPITREELNGSRAPNPYFYNKNQKKTNYEPMYPTGIDKAKNIHDLPSKQSSVDHNIENLRPLATEDVPIESGAQALMKHLGLTTPMSQQSYDSTEDVKKKT